MLCYSQPVEVMIQGLLSTLKWGFSYGFVIVMAADTVVLLGNTAKDTMYT